MNESEDFHHEYRITLRGDALIAAAALVARIGPPLTIEEFMQRAIAHGLRANGEDVEDDAIEVAFVEGADPWNDACTTERAREASIGANCPVNDPATQEPAP